MRKRFGQILRIGVSRRSLALVKTNRWSRAAPEVLGELSFSADASPGFDAIAAGVRQLLQDAGCARWTASVVLADDLVRLWQVSPPPGSTRLADLEAAAALRFQNLYGDSPAHWSMSAGWDASHPFLAAAMPRQLLALLEQAAHEQQVKLVEIAPQFIANWNQWRKALPSGAWFGQLSFDVLTLGVTASGSVSTVRCVAPPAGAGLEWLEQHVAREALRLNLPAPSQLAMAGKAPSAWNGNTVSLACTLLGAGQGSGWSEAVRLAVTGSRA